MSLKVIVIGGVAAGPKTAARIMRLNPGAEVTIIEKVWPYDKVRGPTPR